MTNLKKIDDHFELSFFKGELTKKTIVQANIKLKNAFPALPVEFFDIFSDRIKDNNYNDERLKAAINHVIDNCIYPTPTIAQFIQFDKCFKLYDYTQYLKLIDELGARANEYYKSVRIDSQQKKPAWVHVNDIEKYNLELWNKTN